MKTQKIAIVGIGCRYPDKVNTPGKLWEFLAKTSDGVREVPSSRWSLDKFYDPDPDAPGKMYVKRASFLHDDIFSFDPNFFGISPREANTLDPQQRLLLETTYEAFQDAGLTLRKMARKKVGVFVGGFMMDNQMLRVSEKGLDHINSLTPVSGSLTLLANRISHAFNLTGPSVSVDTACSSSLVAVHLACEALMTGSATTAVAGGVTVLLGPQPSILMCKGKFLAKDGRSKAFFDEADGYGRGEGAGMVALKKLEDAEQDKDRIYAVIEATAVNQDGFTEGISLPNQESQIEVIRETVGRAGIDPAKVDYVEAHGTGTKAGDPLELGALGEVYGKGNRQNPLAVGSVKINLGHTEAAAGITGLIKATLSLHQQAVLPHMNLGELNRQIPFDDLNLKIPLEGSDWYRAIKPRYAAVNSFGYGGTNAHAILSRYQTKCDSISDPAKDAPEPSRKRLMQVSARSRPSLQKHLADLHQWVKANEACELEDLQHTLNHCRDLHDFVKLFQTDSLADFAQQLSSFNEETILNPAAGKSDQLVWIFTGMGPQWWGMGQQLYRSEPVFRQALDHCNELFLRQTGFSFLDEMLKEEKDSRLGRNSLAQAANFFVQYGLSELLQNWGMKPDLIVGHSVGEVAAAVVAGSLTLEQGIRVIHERGRLLERIAGKGTLMAVGLGREEALEVLAQHPEIEIATINSPKSVALAGTKTALEKLQHELEQRKVFAKFVRVEVAYHSSQADGLKEDFLEAFSFVRPAVPHTPLYSTVLAGRVDGPLQDGDYWWRNVRNQVHFCETMTEIVGQGLVNFMEIGPHPVLGAAVGEIARELDRPVNTFHSLKRLNDEEGTLLDNLARVMQAGVEITLAGEQGRKLNLPLYSWDKDRYWEEDASLREFRTGEESGHPFLQQTPDPGAAAWKCDLRRPALLFLEDHKVGKHIVFPGAGYLECLLGLARFNDPAWPLVLEHMRFDKPLLIGEGQFPKLLIRQSDENVRVASSLDGTLTQHAIGRIGENKRYTPGTFDRETGFHLMTPPDDCYLDLAGLGLNYGPAFQGIQEINLNEREVFARISVSPSTKEETQFVMHPSLLDAAFQALLLSSMNYHESKAFLPVEIEGLRIFRPVPDSLLCHGQLTGISGRELKANLTLLSEDYEVVAELEGLTCREPEIKQGDNPAQDWLYQYTRVPADPDHWAPLDDITTVWHSLDSLPDRPALDEGSQLVMTLDDPASGDPCEDGCKMAQKLRALFSSSTLQRAKRVVLVSNEALIDEQSYPLEAPNLAQSPVIGLARVMMAEQPEIDLHLVDIDDTEASKATLSRLLTTDFDSEEIIIREGNLFAGSLEKATLEYANRENYQQRQRDEQPKKLAILKPGKMETLVLRDYDPKAPADEEVRIRVSHSSINFKDVMKAMGMLNEEALRDTFAGQEFGLEGTGTITETGQGVTDLKVGDRVYFMAAGLKSHITVSQSVCVKIPEGLTLEGMASIFVYITAWAGIIKMGHLQAGEKVLIHSAAGGVGLAACHIARMMGAEIHATAGTEEKRQFLRDLGIAYVYDSRSLNFASQIRANAPDGVDVVLNSLAGEPLRKSVELLKTLGRFVELGKQDMTNHARLDLAPFNKSIQFIALDLDKITPLRPDFMCSIVEELFEHFLDTSLPMLPYEVLPVNQLEEAFRKLAKGSHIGKVVVDFNIKDLTSLPVLEKEFSFSSDEVALITGGCAGYGLKTALYLADWGLKNIALASRKGKVGPQDRWILEKLKRKEVRVIEMAMDVTSRQEVYRGLEKLQADGLHLAGVVHAATILNDRVVSQVSSENFDHEYEPKARGAWNLHLATRKMPLQFFICYSSIVSYTGNPGQFTYAASNSFLDGLMAHRVAKGLEGLSVSWGAIAEVGILTRNQHADAHLKSVGVEPINPDKGLALLKDVTLNRHAHLAVAKVDWDRWATATPGRWERLASLRNASGASDHLPELVSHLADLPAEERLAEVRQAVKEILVSTTGAKPEAITDETILSKFGMDSIMAVELTVEFQTIMGIELSVMEILGSGSVLQLAQNCLNQIDHLQGSSDGPSPKGKSREAGR